MGVKAPSSLKVETEGDLQVLYFTLSSVSDADTTNLSSWFKLIRGISTSPSTTAAIGSTNSAGIITWKVSTGTPDLVVRVAGGA